MSIKRGNLVRVKPGGGEEPFFREGDIGVYDDSNIYEVDFNVPENPGKIYFADEHETTATMRKWGPDTLGLDAKWSVFHEDLEDLGPRGLNWAERILYKFPVSPTDRSPEPLSGEYAPGVYMIREGWEGFWSKAGDLIRLDAPLKVSSGRNFNFGEFQPAHNTDSDKWYTTFCEGGVVWVCGLDELPPNLPTVEDLTPTDDAPEGEEETPEGLPDKCVGCEYARECNPALYGDAPMDPEEEVEDDYTEEDDTEEDDEGEDTIPTDHLKDIHNFQHGDLVVYVGPDQPWYLQGSIGKFVGGALNVAFNIPENKAKVTGDGRWAVDTEKLFPIGVCSQFMELQVPEGVQGFVSFTPSYWGVEGGHVRPYQPYRVVKDILTQMPKIDGQKGYPHGMYYPNDPTFVTATKVR